MKRRDFMKTSLAGAAVAGSLVAKPARSQARPAANDYVSLALMGARTDARGYDLAGYFTALPDVRIPVV